MNTQLHGLLMRLGSCAMGFLVALAVPVSTWAADWPCYRADGARSATTSEELTFPLGLRWVYTPTQRPRPAWPDAVWGSEGSRREHNRILFDGAPHPVVAGDRFVTYVRARWQVTPATPDNASDSQDKEPSGKWETVEHVVPDLTLNVDGKRVEILCASGVTMSGPLHEQLVRAYSSQKATYEGEMLAEGSERLRGFYNGDLTTVLGKKASTEGIIPDELFAGDRVAFVQHKKDAARGLFIGGLCMMGIAPLVLLGGVLSALFKRRR